MAKQRGIDSPKEKGSSCPASKPKSVYVVISFNHYWTATVHISLHFGKSISSARFDLIQGQHLGKCVIIWGEFSHIILLYFDIIFAESIERLPWSSGARWHFSK